MKKLSIEEMENRIKELEKQLKRKEKKIEDLEYKINIDENSVNLNKFAKSNYRYIREKGVLAYLKAVVKGIGRIFKLMFKTIGKRIEAIFAKGELQKILKENADKEIIIFYPGYDWYMKMYQRPQHIASQLAKKNILYFYCTLNINDNVHGFEKIEDNLYVTNHWNLLKKMVPHYTLQMYANMNGCWVEELKEIQEKGNNILYEYIDDLHEDLTTIPDELLIRHEYALKDESIKVLATAQYLYDKALEYRKKNIILSTNGVIYEDFHKDEKLPIPEKIEKLVKSKKKLIGYYGALAKWFDYELIKEIAEAHSDYNILLIGVDYDKSFAKYNYFKDVKNIHYIGPVNYKELVNYGACCDVLTIPFLINDITLATSPVKVFEYMAMEKPIVTTDLPECRKYKSVLISKTHKAFIKNLEKAIEKAEDPKYKELLRKEALANTWQKKADEIVELINKR